MLPSSDPRGRAAARKRTYAILSALHAAPPSEELLAMLADGGLSGEEGTPLAAAADDLAAASHRAVERDLRADDLAAEHTRLFALPSGVVPHESFYCDEHRRLGGRVTVDVKRFYERAHAQVTESCLEMPDHIGVELEFMKFLCDLEEQFWDPPDPVGLRECLHLQHGFLEEHLGRWHRRVCERIHAETTSELYRALARLTIEFVDSEREYARERHGDTHAERRTACSLE